MIAAVQNPGKAGFNAALNGYRGLCALLVYVFHIGSAGVLVWPDDTPAERALTYLWSSLTYGVEMFFMISGFVILGSLLRHPSVGGFLRDRFARIYSAWVPALCAVTFVCLLWQIPPLRGLGAAEIAALFTGNLLLLPPIVRFPMIHQVSWSLSYEWVFYFVSAVAALMYRSERPNKVLMGIWFALAALFIALFPRSLFFVTGVIVFHYRDWFAARRHWLRYPLVSLLVFLVAWRATDILKAHLNDTIFDFILDGRWIAMVIAFVASLHLFASVTLDASRQTAFLSSRVFQFLGNISYSFYLWHALVMAVAKRLVQPYVVPEYGVGVGLFVFAVGSLIVALPVSWISWKLFEVKLAALMRGRRREPASLGRTVSAT